MQSMATKTIHFSEQIEAPVALVWDIMLNDASYRIWTTPFIEGSYFEGSWEEGQEIRFFSPDGCGLVSRIAVNRPHEYISIEHCGEIIKGVVDTESERVKAWLPAYENYKFNPTAAGTELLIAMDVSAECELYMIDTWPKALYSLKELCEAAARH